MYSKTNALGVQIEIEKKYNLTEQDYKIIKEKTSFIEEVNIKDYYLDNNLVLAKNWYFLRLRDWKYELKISKADKNLGYDSCEEYDNEDDINEKLSKFWITTDDVIWICFIDTFREKYEYNYEWQKITIDIDRYQYWKRYEIEVLYQSNETDIQREQTEEKISKLIDNFRKEIWLTWESNSESYKIVNCAMHQNINLFEIIS